MSSLTIHLSSSWPRSRSLGNVWTQTFAKALSYRSATDVVAGEYIILEDGVDSFFTQSEALIAKAGDQGRVCLFLPDSLPTRSFVENSESLLGGEPLAVGVEVASGELLYVAGEAPVVRAFFATLIDFALPGGSRARNTRVGPGDPVDSSGSDFRPHITYYEGHRVSRGAEDFWLAPDEDLPTTIEARAQAEVLVIEKIGPGTLALSRPFSYVRGSISRLGFYARQLEYAPGASDSSREPSASGQLPYSLDDIDVVAVTTDRWESVRWLLRSVREQLGDRVTITVVVQAHTSRRWRGLSRSYRANFLYVDQDFGLSAGRNLAVASTRRRLVFLMDDDFVLDDRCRTLDALEVLSVNPGLSVLGGNLLDVKNFSDGVDLEVSQGFAMEALSGPPRLTWLRLESRPRERIFLDEYTYFERCDIVDNFALFVRKDTFDRGLKWRPELKIMAEHQALYVDALDLDNVLVARTNALRVRNVRIQNLRYRLMRFRPRFFSLWFDAQELSSFEVLGRFGRFRDTGGFHHSVNYHPHFSWQIHREG